MVKNVQNKHMVKLNYIYLCTIINEKQCIVWRMYNINQSNKLKRCQTKWTRSFSLSDKPVILQLSSTCVVDNLEVLCRCSVDSNPKAAVTWSVNGTVPPHDYNMSTTSQPGKLTATLWGRMDKPQTVICFAVNALGNDSLMLLQGAEGVFLGLFCTITKTTSLPLVICLVIAGWSICAARLQRGENEILQRKLPLINYFFTATVPLYFFILQGFVCYILKSFVRSYNGISKWSPFIRHEWWAICLKGLEFKAQPQVLSLGPTCTLGVPSSG